MVFGRGTTYFLGNSAAHAVAVYSAAKVYEFLGTKSHAELLEEFGHMELFSLKKSDSVNILTFLDPSGVAARLNGALLAQGYASRLVSSRGSSLLERLFHSVFVAQLAVLREAQDRNLPAPMFTRKRKQLNISDSMIY